MNYTGQKYKYFCKKCGNVWFSNSYFEDLCRYVLCESYYIYSLNIKKVDRERFNNNNDHIVKYKNKVKKLEKTNKDLSWLK